MPVKKKAAPATPPAAPAKKSPVKKPAAAKAPAKTTAKKATRRTLKEDGLLPASSLPPAVLPPPAGKKPRAPRQMGDDTPGTALARAVAQAADMKKAENIIILDVRGISMVTDFLVIASGTSMPHIRAIRNEIAERIREDRNEKPHSSQGMAESHWMLLDYGDVVAHVFLADMRENYALEDLWGDAPRLEWTPL
jgi:ribosome silencing factor RsfS/YbeB/iojap